MLIEIAWRVSFCRLEVMEFFTVIVCMQVDFTTICKDVDVACVDAMRSLPDQFVCVLVVGSGDLSGNQLLQWAESVIEAEAYAADSVNAALNSPAYLKIVCAAFSKAFESDPQLKRLDTFHKLLVHPCGKLYERVTEALLEVRPQADELVQHFKATMLCRGLPNNPFRLLQTRVSRCIIKHIIMHVKIRSLVIPSSFRFTEDSTTAQKRVDFDARIANFAQATDVISRIEDVFDEDSYKDEAVRALLAAARGIDGPEASAAAQNAAVAPVQVPISTAALYDSLDDHRSASGSPSFAAQTAQVQAEMEDIPVSPVASDFSYVNVP